MPKSKTAQAVAWLRSKRRQSVKADDGNAVYFGLAEHALKKQIPVPPVQSPQQSSIDQLRAGLAVWFCPRYEAMFVNRRPDYCQDCGQRLKWEEVDGCPDKPN